ncbi:MAG TPA: 2,3,4,5-tetrahydropyridine-2,6-dicarboxylate N-succinyltransferase, partial [Methylococcaceae bacterium]|nr:2,3,4,5-tetrahydropyridine-2,6-dicarboxylate N-succinyltransferase [Methylococcaceae bacterium]
MSNLIKVINAAWEQRSELAPTSVDAEIVEAIEHCIDGLDSGELRVAEPKEGNWVVNDWLKKAVLLS